jgi:hypothetical protein
LASAVNYFNEEKFQDHFLLLRTRSAKPGEKFECLRRSVNFFCDGI